MQRDVAGHKEYYVRMRKEYDKITIYENMFNRLKEQQKEFKTLKKNFKKIVDKFFTVVFPNYKSQDNGAEDKKRQIRKKVNINRHMRKRTNKSGMDPPEEVPSPNSPQIDLLYDPELQQILEERIEYYEQDSTVHLLQLSYFQILNFLEQIIETELYILEGTGFGVAQQENTDLLAFHGKTIQARTMIKEQQQILKFLRLERFYLFLYWTHSAALAPSLALSERDFIYKRCIGSLKRLRQFVYSVNYLVMSKKRVQLLQAYQNIRSFLMNTVQMMIDNLQSMAQGGGESKHMVLLKTLYGMADEMLSKNFLEDKKTN